MSYDFDDDGADIRRVKEEIREIRDEINTLPFNISGVNLDTLSQLLMSGMNCFKI